MKCRENDSNFAQIVIRHTTAFLDNSISRDAWVMDSLIPALERSGVIDTCAVKPNVAETLEEQVKLRKRKCKQIERMIKGETPLPAVYVLPWISALPDKHRLGCQHDMAAALGTMFTPIEVFEPHPGGTRAVRSRLDVLTQEYADVLKVAAAAWDGMYDERDTNEQLQQIADELFELNAATMAEMGRIHLSRGIAPRGYRMMKNSPLFRED